MVLKIKRNTVLGALDAETDTKLLESCFVDKGDLSRLMDVNDPSAIILGRTGSGKSALMYKIHSVSENSIRLDPNDISVSFLEYSNIIQFFEALNINLDLFYRLLWRHILTVELLRLRYNIKSAGDAKSLHTRISTFFKKDRVKTKALEYFEEWGDRFWLDTDEQLREITSRLESQTKAGITGKFPNVNLSVEGVEKLSENERTEIKQRATQVVNSLQVKKLNEIINLLAEFAFDDMQRKYYILIDQLDEDWANTNTRCRFIRALIEEIKNFRKLPPVKIIIALRKDLLELVFDKTRDSGFQQEKYESYILPLIWSAEDLKSLVELRINEVFKSQYTRQDVGFDDIFPAAKKGGGQTSFDYMLERTLWRPRDILQFSNECFNVAFDRERISWRSIVAAENSYSKKRLRSLSEEWSEFYPNLSIVMELLRGRVAEFSRGKITTSQLEEIMTQYADVTTPDDCFEIIDAY